MADIAISNLPNELTTPVDGDLLAIDDISASETKKIQVSNLLGGATQAEMGHVHGVTSDIQTQINGLDAAKAPKASPTFTGTVTLPGDPASSLHAATKQYVDAIASGLDIKASCRVASAAALPANTAAGSGAGKTLTINAVGILTVDGVNTVLNDRILVKNEATGANNGIYKVTTEGTAGVAAVLTRATDFDQDAEVTAGAFAFIEEGTASADKGFVLTTNDPITVDTTSLSFTSFSSAGGGLSNIVEDTSPQLGGDLDCNTHGINMGDQVLDQPKIRDYGESVNALGDLGGGTDAINLELGNVVTATVSTSAQTFTFTNPPASGTAGSFTLILTNGGSQTITWPASVKWEGGTAPTLTASGIDILTFITVDGGTTWYGFAAGLDMSVPV